MAKTSLRVEDELYRQARHRALDEGVTFQELVDRALRTYLKKPAAKVTAATARKERKERKK
jgi:hypothetical protein